ncbi:MAG: HlyD family efflux transporter periplasmic adaptor subunit [Phycisphaerae bacterium]|nr:HlyD family efflux transporter periplasmic adaptor subunit [Phycisphaerae bacterium]
MSLAQTENDSEALVQKLLGVLVGLTGARGGASFLQRDQGLRMLPPVWPDEFNAALPKLPETLRQFAGEVTSTRKAAIRSLENVSGQIDTQRWVAVASPVFWHDRVFGAMCLMLDLGPQGRPEPYLAVLQGVAACFQVHVQRRVGGAHQLLSQQMSVVLDAIGRSVSSRNATEMVYFLANEIHQHLACHQVAIGWRVRNDKAKVVAISGQARFEKRGDTARAIRDAMSEALRQERHIAIGGPSSAAPEEEDSPGQDQTEAGRPIDLAHQHLMEVCQTDCVLTHPLRSGDDIIAMWTFQWRKDRLPTPADERLIAVATGQVGPVIHWARRADQGVIRRTGRNLADLSAKLIGSGHLVAKGITFGVAALLAVLIFVRVPFRVGGNSVLQPTPRRYLTARFDGVLKEAHVRPGDVAEKGKLLAELEDYQIRDELGLARAEWHEAMKESDALWAKGKLADSQLAKIRAEKAQARIDLLQFQLDHVRLTAPIDGVVLTGDLERARGVPVKQGQVLFEIAPLDRMILEVAVPDADAARIQPGQTGELSLEARPERTIEFRVERVRPQAEIRDEKNTFIVEADIENSDKWLRPGMEGNAKIGVGRKPIGWLLTYKLVDWLRMKLWW